MKLPSGYVEGIGAVKPTGYGGFGERLLRGMGWEKGRGLGKAEQGMKEALEVKRKEDTTGVGANSTWKWDDNWWERAFDSAAQTVTTAGESDSDTDSDDPSSSSSSSSSDDSGDEVDNAVFDAGETGNQSRSRRQSNRDGTLSSASAAELKLLASLSKGGRIAAGRFGGRDAKMARIRAQEAKLAAAAAAKLGARSEKPAPDGTAGASDLSETTSEAAMLPDLPTKKRRRDAADKQQGDDALPRSDAKRCGGSEQHATTKTLQEPPMPPASQRKRIVIEPAMPQQAHGSYRVQDGPITPLEGWWGAAVFKSVGCLEGLRRRNKEQEKEQRGFSEADQTRLYCAAHAGKTQGKLGLGQGTGTVKVAGVKWSGKKVTFSMDEGAAVERLSEAAEARQTANGEAVGLQRLKPVGSTSQLQNMPSDPGCGGGKKDDVADIKWKKVVAKILKAAPGGEMTVKALRRRVHANVLATAAGLDNNNKGGVSKGEVKVALKGLLATKKFVVNGKRVMLANKKR